MLGEMGPHARDRRHETVGQPPLAGRTGDRPSEIVPHRLLHLGIDAGVGDDLDAPSASAT